MPKDTDKYGTKDLIERTFDMPPEDSIIIPTKDFRATERLRNALYREVNRLRNLSPELADEIRISRQVKGNVHSVILSRFVNEVPAAFYVKGDGTISQLDMEKSAEVLRVEKLMREDGVSEVDIEEYLKTLEEVKEEDEDD